MAIRFVEIHPTPDPAKLNQEWVVIENTGKLAFHTRGVGMTVARAGKKSMLGVIDPGFVLEPGQRMRMCTGLPGVQDDLPPDDQELKNYFLLLRRPYLTASGVSLTLVLRGGVQVGRAEFDASAPQGVKGA